MSVGQYVREEWDRVSAGVLVALGALLLVCGWLGVRDKLYPAQQIPYEISGGLGGLFLLGLGAALWISADVRDEWRKLDAVDRSLASIEAALGTHSVAGASPAVDVRHVEATLAPVAAQRQPG